MNRERLLWEARRRTRQVCAAPPPPLGELRRGAERLFLRDRSDPGVSAAGLGAPAPLPVIEQKKGGGHSHALA